MQQHIEIEKIDLVRWRIKQHGLMQTDGIIYASEAMIPHIQSDQSLVQVANVACLPGIVGSSLAMPDIHWGYGFPIGGVAAFDHDTGIISPGGVGYDINCGVRLYATSLDLQDISGRLALLVDQLVRNIPSGVGSQRRDLKLSAADYRRVLLTGAAWAVEHGYGEEQDIHHTEDHGCIKGADPEVVSERACERGRQQLGTLGSGNHFVEIAVVDEVYDQGIAQRLGLVLNRIAVTVHTGSRGFGYQVCDDFLKVMLKAAQKYHISIPDRQLCCAPLTSPEGRQYMSAMAAAANYAFANRQIIGHWIRETFAAVLGASHRELKMVLVYDICHNIAKIEEHVVSGKRITVCVHRKGATRAFPAGHPQLPPDYRDIGQPVLIPGDMGRYSYVLVGTERAMQETFGSSCHGAGRMMSRNEAIKASRGRSIAQELHDQGIVVRAAGRETLSEEMPEAYKDVALVVDTIAAAGIGKKVVRLRPLGVIKG